MRQAVFDFVFRAKPEDNQKFLEYVEMVKHAKSCIESYKIRFEYSTFYAHISVLKQDSKINILGHRAESDTKIVFRNKKTSDSFLHFMKFKDVCSFAGLSELVNKSIDFNKRMNQDHHKLFCKGLKND